MARTPATRPPSAQSASADTQAASKASAKASAPQLAMARLGLVRDIDLALHLPLRYEDETAITPLRQARDGQTVQDDVWGLVEPRAAPLPAS